jgi:hypothetical protein
VREKMTEQKTKIGKYLVRAEDGFVYAPDEENDEEKNIEWTWNQIDDLLAESQILRSYEPEEGIGSVFMAKHPDLGYIICTKQEEGQDVCITTFDDSGRARQLFGETKHDLQQGRCYWW